MERRTFSGSFGRYGRNGTVLLQNICDDTGTVVTDHLWFAKMKCFQQFGILNNSDVLVFDARVRTYRRSKGTYDYRLSHPSKVRLKTS